MNDATQKLIEKADQHLRESRSYDAGECFQQAARKEEDAGRKSQLWQRAAEVYAGVRSNEDVRTCYRQAAELLDGQEKADCLMKYWRHLIVQIAGTAWECCYEWRGEMDDSHDDDHEYNQRAIQQYKEEAERLLDEILNIEGIKPRRIIKQAKKECKRRQKDGWGAKACWQIIANAEGKRAT